MASDSDSGSDTLGLPPGQVAADEEWDAWAADEGDEGDADATRSLFEPSRLLPSPEAALAHDAATHGFDLLRFRSQLRLDDYGTIKLVNFIRRAVAGGRDPRPDLAAAATGSDRRQPPWDEDTFLQPVVADDPLLTYEYDEAGQQHEQGGGEAAAAPAAGHAAAVAAGGEAADAAATIAALRARVAALSSSNHELQLRVAALMEVALPPELRQELREAAAEGRPAGVAGASSSACAATAAAGASSSAAAGAGVVHVSVPGAGAASRRALVDAAYFDSYSYFDIHQEMLADKPRTQAYKSALLRNPGLLSGATVLDVGCGTGILSLFAARGGAAAVVGLDGSERIAGFARQVVAANGLSGADGAGPVTIITGKVEDVPDIGHTQVSVIVSEWMGYALLFESMLDSLLAARDRWLAPGGAVLPDRASIWLAGADSSVFGTAFWRDVHGFSMAPISDELCRAAAAEGKVLVRPVEAAALSTPAVCVQALDLVTMTPAEQDFTATFRLTTPGAQQAASSSVQVAAVVLWFDVQFSERFCKECPVTLSTAPAAAQTHWAQAVLPLKQPVSLAAAGDAGNSSSSSSSLSCRLSMARNRSKHRCLDISLEVTPAAAGGSTQTMAFTMGVADRD